MTLPSLFSLSPLSNARPRKKNASNGSLQPTQALPPPAVVRPPHHPALNRRCSGGPSRSFAAARSSISQKNANLLCGYFSSPAPIPTVSGHKLRLVGSVSSREITRYIFHDPILARIKICHCWAILSFWFWSGLFDRTTNRKINIIFLMYSWNGGEWRVYWLCMVTGMKNEIEWLKICLVFACQGFRFQSEPELVKLYI